MGGLSRRFSSSSTPPTPSITPKLVEDEEEDPVPLYFLDETGELSAGIESSPPAPQPARRCSTGSSLAVPIPSLSPLRKKKKMQDLTSVLRKEPAGPSTSKHGKLKKVVRFLDLVEVLPIPAFEPSDDESDEDKPCPKKQKTCDGCAEDATVDEGIASGLGRAGSPRRAPSASTRDLSPSPEPDGRHEYVAVPRVELWSPPPPPPSWRIPPEFLSGRHPRVRPPPRVRSPTQPDAEIDLMAHDSDDGDSGFSSGSLSDFSSDDDDEEEVRPGVSYVRASPPSSPPQSHGHAFRPPPIHPVMARKMWPRGEVRYEDQWGRRLIPVGSRDSFRFDLWPVEEDVAAEGAGGTVRGAWVKTNSGEIRRVRRRSY